MLLNAIEFMNTRVLYSPEGGAHVYRHVFVSLFKTSVFFDEVQVVTTNDNCPLHFHLSDYSTQDTATNVYWTSERAFLVNVCSVNSLRVYNQCIIIYSAEVICGEILLMLRD